MSVRALEASEKRTLAILGLPTAALALAITVVTTYVPVAASEFLDSSIVIGGLIAIEGVLALWLPLVVGSWSDRLRTSIGGRLPFLVAATPIACVSLAVTGLVQRWRRCCAVGGAGRASSRRCRSPASTASAAGSAPRSDRCSRR
jgi:MFS family permease